MSGSIKDKYPEMAEYFEEVDRQKRAEFIKEVTSRKNDPNFELGRSPNVNKALSERNRKVQVVNAIRLHELEKLRNS